MAHVREKLMLDRDMIADCTFRLNEDGEPVSCVVNDVMFRITPYTDEMRIQAYRMRGREGFSFGKAVCVLPSARFYRRRERVVDSNLEELREEDMDYERDEED